MWKDLAARRELEGVRSLSLEDARRRSEQPAQIEEVILTKNTRRSLCSQAKDENHDRWTQSMQMDKILLDKVSFRALASSVVAALAILPLP